MNYWERDEVALRDIWNQRRVRIACGGEVGLLVEAVLEEGTGGKEAEWDFGVVEEKGEEKRRSMVEQDLMLKFVWRKFVPKEKNGDAGEGGSGEAEKEPFGEEDEEEQASYLIKEFLTKEALGEDEWEDKREDRVWASHDDGDGW